MDIKVKQNEIGNMRMPQQKYSSFTSSVNFISAEKIMKSIEPKHTGISILKNQRGQIGVFAVIATAALALAALLVIAGIRACSMPRSLSYINGALLGQNYEYKMGKLPSDANVNRPIFASTESDGDICLSYTDKNGNAVVQHYGLSPVIGNKYFECGKFIWHVNESTAQVRLK